MAQQDTTATGGSSSGGGGGRIALIGVAAAAVIGIGGYFALSQQGTQTSASAPAPAAPSAPAVAPATAADYEVSAPIAFDLPEGNTAVNDTAGGFTTIASTVANTSPGGRVGGARIELAPALEDKFSGRTVEVTITARRAAANGSDTLRAAYSTNSVGNSGWRDLKLTDSFSDVSFTYDVPARQAEPGTDYVGMVADPAGTGKAVDVKAIRITIVK